MKISSPIVNYAVVPKTPLPPSSFTLIERPSVLQGCTYKIIPADGASYYITINNITLNNIQLPYEFFIESKDPSHKDWAIALSRLISAIFRINASFAGIYDVSFIIEELSSVFSPNGYFVKSKFYNSLPHHIADTIKTHLVSIGYIQQDNQILPKTPSNSFTSCPKCYERTVTILDGCETCTSCGFSKCG